MAWFDGVYRFTKSSLKIAHITDCHLFSDSKQAYFGVNTFDYFTRTIKHCATQNPDAVIFGGDLTQDHSLDSYLLFAEVIAQANLSCPVFWVPGNHDEIDKLKQISEGQIYPEKHLSSPHFDILLLNSKGVTPAGWIEQAHLSEIKNFLAESNRPAVTFCHHNPLPIDGYLDKHMLENGPQLLNTLINSGQVDNLFHGHVHNQYQLSFRGFDVYATAASSVQFAKNTPSWQQCDLGPSYRIINIQFIKNSQQLDVTTDVIWLDE